MRVLQHYLQPIVFLLGLFLTTGFPLFGQFDVSARVVRVGDGDTITIQAGEKQFRVRLHGIDAPETRQPRGPEARRVLEELLGFNQGSGSPFPLVRLMVTDIDRYGRIIARVFFQNREINLAMLELGYAWHYVEFDQTLEYAEAQERARTTRAGLWADTNPIAPWEWRRQ